MKTKNEKKKTEKTHNWVKVTFWKRFTISLVCSWILKNWFFCILEFPFLKEIKFHFQDRGILSDSMKDCEIGYILSLGVHRNYRRNGIGSLLLDTLIQHLSTAERNKVKAVFLHVLTTNQTAILFYERRQWVFLGSFWRFRR